MKLLSAACVLSCLVLGLGTALADDGALGKKKGGGGGGQSGGGGGSTTGGGSNHGSGGGSGIGSGGSGGGSHGGGGGGSHGGGGGGIGSGGGGSHGGPGGGIGSGGGGGQSGGGTSGGGVSSGGSTSGGGVSSGGSRGGGGFDPGKLGPGRGRSDGGSNRGGSGSGGTSSGGGISSGGGGIGSGGIFGGGTSGRPQGSVQRGAPAQGGFDSDLLGKKRSHSGDTNYGTVNNTRTRSGRTDPITITRAPIDLRSGSLANQVRREDRVRISSRNILRTGYYHYDQRWCDDYFYYPYYAFDFRSQCVCSPWYYYVSLPPYLSCNRITYINYTFVPFVGVSYNWRPIDYNRRDGSYGYGNYSSLDYAIDDLVSAFENGDRRAAGRLVPRRGGIQILMDGQYAYTVNPDDFYDLFMDAVESTRTRDYRILDVRRTRDQAAVTAEHRYEDPWGREVRVYHYFKLEYDRGGYVIREFGTSDSRW